MSKNPFKPLRPARIGDLCLLVGPSIPDEILSLEQRQLILQELVGGVVVTPVHMTCQRFEAPDPELLPQFVRELGDTLREFQSFKLTTQEFTTLSLENDLNRTNILKWCISNTGPLRNLNVIFERQLTTSGFTPLYPAGWISLLVSALKDIPSVDIDHKFDQIPLPQHLFTAGKITLSRILGADQFQLLAELPITIKQ